MGHLLHLRFVHTQRGRPRRPESDPRRGRRRQRVERDGVLVQGDSDPLARLLRVRAGHADRLEVDQRKMRIGAAGDQPETFLGQAIGQGAGGSDRSVGVVGEVRLHGFLQTDGFGRDAVLEGTSLHHGEDRLVDGLRVLVPAQDHGPPGPPQRLVRREGHHVRVGHRTGVRTARDEADEVRRVDHEDGADLVGDRAERGEVDHSWVGRESGEDHLRSVFQRQVADPIHVDDFGVLVHFVAHEGEPLPREVDRRTVGEVPPVGQHHAQHLLFLVLGLEEGPVGSHVRLRPRVGLDVRVLGAEEPLGPLDCQGLRHVDELAAAVVALPRIPFRVLVVHRRGQRRKDGRARVVLGGDQPERRAFPLELAGDGAGHLGVGGFQGLPVCRELSHPVSPSSRNRSFDRPPWSPSSRIARTRSTSGKRPATILRDRSSISHATAR